MACEVAKSEEYQNAVNAKWVYPPVEDTFLLINALENELDFIKRVNPLYCLEFGVGSGLVTGYVMEMLGENRCYFGVDINPLAAQTTLLFEKVNPNCFLDIVLTNYGEALIDRMKHKFDLIYANPPYCPTPVVPNKNDTPIKLANNGGPSGNVVMIRLLKEMVPQLLSENGVFYMECIEVNDIKLICEIAQSVGLKYIVDVMKAPVNVECIESDERFVGHILKFMRNGPIDNNNNNAL